MKSIKFFSFWITLLLIPFSTSFAQNNISIKGKLENNKEFENVELHLAYGKNPSALAMTKVQTNGTFLFQINIPQPDIYRLVFDDKNSILLPLTPDEKIEIVLDADNLQWIPEVKGSVSLKFIKELIDVVLEKNVFLDSINKKLQNDPQQLYFSDFGQKFNLYHQTNQDVDNYIQKVYQYNDELQELVKKYNENGSIPPKSADVFLKSSINLMDKIADNYAPFTNYKYNVSEYYDFSNEKSGKDKDFDKKMEQYLLLLNSRHQRVEDDWNSMIVEIRNIVASYETNKNNKEFENKKNKNKFCNQVLAFAEQGANFKVNSDKYIENTTTSNLLAKELISDAQKKVSAIVKEYQEMYNTGDKQRSDKMAQLLQTHKDDIAILMFIDSYVGKEQNPTFYQEIINTLVKKYPTNPLVLQKKKELDEASGPLAYGSVAPDMEYDNPNGVKMKLSNLRGNIVLIDFWASWCRPCRMENPNVVKLYEKYHDKGFDIYSVSLDRDKTSWVNAIKSDNLSWNSHVSDLKYWSSAGAKQYGVSSIPSTFLLDREGRIIGKNLRGEALANKLREIFGE